MPKILSIDNVGLFFNTFPHVQVGIFPDPCHKVNSVGLIHPVIGFNTLNKFVGLTRGGARIFIEEGQKKFTIVGQNGNIREAVEDGPCNMGPRRHDC